MFYVIAYISCIVIVNQAFGIVPLLSLPNGELWSPVALLVGFVFILRDYAQRAVGHWVVAAMLIGGIISWFMATPQIALASITAFLIGEFMDWSVYSFTKRPFSQRVLLSSIVSTPIDSFVFLYMVGIFSIPSLFMMTISKLLGACIVYFIARKKEQNLAFSAQ
ncbi:VUT family protein [Desulfovibrio litoralis]|uniref:Putative vitamin uptake transporter n=1 Tax=Desulfovibrio litoralis DSM 11393 TaxID=1121455 RepID=A0A1M7TIJ7_9BACT|nr:VUT family protein [Desulfovibrio litoralis]SHN70599.1 Putative vitamin uptake transporter [Desulfovibrio litoralis DSM 11393]